MWGAGRRRLWGVWVSLVGSAAGNRRKGGLGCSGDAELAGLPAWTDQGAVGGEEAVGRVAIFLGGLNSWACVVFEPLRDWVVPDVEDGS